MASLTTKRAVIRKAEAMLKAAEVDYAILAPDGELLGTLDVRREGEVEKPKRQLRFDWIAETNYSGRIQSMNPGELIEFDITDPTLVPEGASSSRASSFYSCVIALLRRLGQQDDFVITSEDGHIEVLRVE